MPSIFEIFGGDGLEGEGGEAPFDPANFDAVLDRAIAERPIAGAPADYVPEGQPLSPQTPDGEVVGGEVGGVPTGGPPEPPSVPPPPAAPPAPVPPVAPPVAPPPAAPAGPADPFAGLSDFERQEALAVLQAMRDPDRALAVRQAYLGVAPTPAAPAAAAPPQAPPEPQLPEDIDPHSFEATMWRENQEMKREIAATRAAITQGQEQSEAQVRAGAAERATAAFSAKYAGRLTEQEILAVAQTAGMRRLPEALRPTSASWDAAMAEALEFTLRSNDTLLTKALGAPAPPPPPVGSPQSRSPEAQTRGRRLTAVSSAASPSGEAPTRQPLEHRGDGKLTEKSRLQLVQEMIGGMDAGSLSGSPAEGM